MSQLNLNLKSQQSYINLEEKSDIDNIGIKIDELELNKDSSIDFFIKGQNNILTLNVDNDNNISLFLKDYPEDIPKNKGRINIPSIQEDDENEKYYYKDIYEIDNPKKPNRYDYPTRYMLFTFEYDNKDKWFEKIPEKEGYIKSNKKIFLEIKGFAKNETILTEVIHGDRESIFLEYSTVGLVNFWDFRNEDDLNDNNALQYSYITHLPNTKDNQILKIEILDYDKISYPNFSLRIYPGKEDDVTLYYVRLYAECDYLPIDSGGD